ncbi:nitrate- and nitrite sensing domain-containing protein [Streptomyces sp. CWNU-52B]|uniref:sensor histidine kinase n=1 Tax=unclassified Streptomyces TaxID=2593676 RepID=UPI0039C096FD
MQKKRPRRKDGQSASGEASGLTPNSPAPQDTPEPSGRGRPAHVRSRLIVAVAVVAAAIAGAGAPSVIAASGQLNDSQNLVTLAERTQDTLALAHSLADERDEVTSYLAAGRPKGEAPSERRSARVDRQVDELRVDAVETDAPASFLKALDAIAVVRRAALTGEGSALEAHQAYSAALTELHALAEDLAEKLPPRAGSGAHALADLDTAVQQAASTRGLLLAALNVPTTPRTTTDPITGLPVTTPTSSAAETKQRDALTAAAQQGYVRERAALADFGGAAPAADRASYESTVNGPDVTAAEKYLADLADQPTLSDAELATSTKKLDAALSARVELMRGVEASLNTRRVKDLAQLRDDDVTALEIRVAVLGALMLLAVGVSTGMARSLTRPLSVLRRGTARLAAEPGTGEPVKFTGRNDEFAQVVRSVNTLHTHALGLQERLATLEGDRKHLIGQRQKMADERDTFRTELTEAAAHLEQVRQSIHGTFVSLALRTLSLVERQLGVIEGLEEREQDPDRLATLFKLDHFATVMRRHSENLLILAGADNGHQHPGPVPLVDVVRAAVSEVERYERVRISALPPHAHLAGFAADDVSHLVAELLENASSFSPPDVPVEVSGWLLESGEVMLSVQDEGIGMTSERLERLNTRLTAFDPQDAYDEESGEGLGLGLYVVARLAHRRGVRVQLREQKQGGITAVVVLPKALLAAGPGVAVPQVATARTPSGAAALSLPGADAEVNSNVLYTRPGRDPLITAAEDSLRESADTGATGAAADSGAEEAPAPPTDGATTAEPTAAPALAAAPTSATGPTDASGPAESAEPAETVELPGSAEQSEPAAAAAAAPADPTEAVEPADAVGLPGAVQQPESAAAVELAEPSVPAEPTEAVQPAEPADAAELPGAAQQPESAAASEHAPADASVPAEPADAAELPTPAQQPEPAAEAAVAPAESAEPVEAVELPASAEHPEPAVAVAPVDASGLMGPAEAVELPEPVQHAHAPEPVGSGDPDEHAGPETTMVLMAPVPPADLPADGPEDTPAVRLPAQATTDHPARPGATDPYAIGPDAHERVPDAVRGSQGPAERVTEKGLPKRTPRISDPAPAEGPHKAAVDAEALRHRLGGFHRGASEGRRDVEAEITENAASPDAGNAAEQTSELQTTAAHAVETKGDTVEEESS